MKEPPPKPTYRSVKTSLKSVVKNTRVTKLTDAEFRANSSMIHALQLLKLYLLHCYDVGDELPKLDRRFVTSVVKVLCKAPFTGRPSSAESQIITDTLKDFYEQHYKAYRSGITLRHGLVRCTTCSRLLNRDTNAASNIWKAATSAIRGEGRPAYLQKVSVGLRRFHTHD